MIHLDPEEWLTVTKDDVPIHPPAPWSKVAANVIEGGQFGVKAMHNKTRVVLSAKQVRNLSSAPTSITVPRCFKCGSKMELKFGKYGGFFGCPKYPSCTHLTSVHALINT